MITLEDITVTLDSTRILTDVSLSFDPGVFVALVGPNGAGKTTLLRTINGLIPPTTGIVTVNGAAIHGLSARAISRLVATVPQETSLGFDFSVRNLVAMGRTPHRGRFTPETAEDRSAVDHALERTATAHLADRPIGTLSGGERQRVLIARAVAQETPILLLDEPTANLDLNHQIQTLSMARAFADEGKTVVAAIHDLELAARFCQTIVLLHNGRVVAQGQPNDVLTADQLERVFDIPTTVGTNPITGTRTITPLTNGDRNERRVDEVVQSPRGVDQDRVS